MPFRLSEADYQRLLKRQPLKGERSKYRSRKVQIDGRWFDSEFEGQRWLQLKTLERMGEIRELRLQVPFDLTVNGHVICRYVADFVYQQRTDTKRDDWERIIEDAKSPATRKIRSYRIKRKLLAALGYQITEVVRPGMKGTHGHQLDRPRQAKKRIPQSARRVRRDR